MSYLFPVEKPNVGKCAKYSSLKCNTSVSKPTLIFHVNMPKCFSDGETGAQINDVVLLAPYYNMFISSFFCVWLPRKTKLLLLLTVHTIAVPPPCPSSEVSRCCCNVINAYQQVTCWSRGRGKRTQDPGHIFLATRPDCLSSVDFHHWCYIDVQGKCHREAAMTLLKPGPA